MRSSSRRDGRSLAGRLWSRRSLRFRISVVALLIGLVGVGAASAISLGVLVRASDDDVHRVLVDRLATLQTRISATGDAVHVAEANDAVFDTTTWVYDRSGRLVDGATAPEVLSRPLAALSRSRAPAEMSVGLYRLRAEPVAGGAAVAVAALDLAPFASSLREAVAVTIALGLLSTAALTAVAFAAANQVLRPVQRMARTAERWDRQRLADRFDLGPPTDELTELAAVLDALLDRVATAIADEERLTAELAHELRTPLTVIDGEAQLALRDPAGAEVRLQRIRLASERMTETVHTLLDVARGPASDGFASTELEAVVSAVIRAQPPTTVRIDRGRGTGVLTAAPAAVVERILAPLVENGVRHAATRLRVTVTRAGHRARIDLENDGDPVPAAIAAHLFEPGVRAPDSPGAGLGLPLALRLAAGVGGTVTLEARDPVVFRVELPAVD